MPRSSSISGASRTSTPRTSTICSSCRVSTPRATGSGRSISGANAGSGCSPSDFGPAYVAQDRARALFLYRGDMTQEWASYGPNAKTLRRSVRRRRQCLRARNAGRHAPAAARIRDCRQPARPLVDRRHRARPQPRPDPQRRDRGHALAGRLRRRTRCDRLGRQASSRHGRPRFPTGSIPARSRKTCSRLTTSRPGRSPLRQPGRRRRSGSTPIDSSPKRSAAPTRSARITGRRGVRTATGRPILANDPHREHSVPSLRYIVQPQCARARRHRRRRTGASRHLDRPQRQHRLRADDLRRRPGRPLRRRAQPRRPQPVSLSTMAGRICARSARQVRGQAARPRATSSCSSPGTARCSRQTPRTTAPLPSARSGSSPAHRPISARRTT